ncbi:hypothetical protein Tco_0340422 [Tanacetum coccineum]
MGNTTDKRLLPRVGVQVPVLPNVDMTLVGGVQRRRSTLEPGTDYQNEASRVEDQGKASPKWAGPIHGLQKHSKMALYHNANE